MIQLNKILKSFKKTIDQLEQLTAANRGVIVQPPLGDEADLRHVHEELYGRGGLLSFEERVIDDILSMLEELEKDASSFAHIYLDAMNRSQTEYHLPRVQGSSSSSIGFQGISEGRERALNTFSALRRW